jgi:hypothetical protein
MNKQEQDYQLIFKRAEKLFRKGNFLLAKKAFENAYAVKPEKDFSKQIEICDEEIEQAKFKDLVKKSRKLLKKNNDQKALTYLEEADKIASDDWVSEKIKELKTKLADLDLNQNAEIEEKAGNFLEAANIYQTLFDTQKESHFQGKQALCLVKAGKYLDALSIYNKREHLVQSDFYHQGFSLANTGKYFECLQVWDSLDTNNSEFTEQKEQVRTLLIDELTKHFKDACNWSELYQKSNYLLGDNNHRDVKKIEQYAKYSWIEELWETENYEKITPLMLPFPKVLTNDLLACYAKVYFKLAELSSDYLSEFIMFWLSALYNPQVFITLSPIIEEREKIRQKLILCGDELIKKWSDIDKNNNKTQTANALWNSEKQLIHNFFNYVGDQKKHLDLVCSAQYAQQFSKQEEICSFLQGNRDSSITKEQYLIFGAHYSGYGMGLIHTQTAALESALEELPKSAKKCEFFDYATHKIKFKLALKLLDKCDKRGVRFLVAAIPLFEISTDFEQELMKQSEQINEGKKSHLWESALTGVLKSKPSDIIKKALSIVMAKHTIEMFNKEEISPANAKKRFEKSLMFYPENKLATGFLNEIRIDIEIDELNQAFSRNKMARAIKITNDSEFREVYDIFFEFFEEFINDHVELLGSGSEALFMLKKMKTYCEAVDEDHEIIAAFDKLINNISKS